MRRPIVPAVLATAAAALITLAAAAQGRDYTIDPGMTKAQVIEHLGQPQSVKNTDTLTFMYYTNGCEKTCGMHDLVTLANGKVVDAIFRDPKRKYTGQSSSPNMVSAAAAKKEGQSRKGGSAAPPPAPMAAPAPRDTGHATVMPAIVPKPQPVPAPMDSAAAKKADSTPPPAKKADTTATKPPRE